MNTSVLSTARRRALIGAAALAVCVAGIPATQAVAAPAAPCTPGPITPTDVTLGLSDTTLSGYQRVDADFSAAIPDGYCDDATLSIKLPDLLKTSALNLPIYDSAGDLMGHAVVPGAPGRPPSSRSSRTTSPGTRT